MARLAAHLLSTTIFFPLLGMLAVLLVPRRREGLVRWLTLAAAAVPLAASALLYARFDRAVTAPQFVEHAPWIPSFHIEYFLGVDGLSVGMVLLTALVSFIAVLASWRIEKQRRGYFALLLLLETGMLGVFCALDGFLFFVFWEVMLLPMYFLIGIWGGARRQYAAVKFFLYTMAGSVAMLLALIALHAHSTSHTFDLIKLAAQGASFSKLTLFGLPFAKVCWIGLFLAFAVKLPMVPFHTWLPDAHVEAPTAISVILAGVLLKMGAYGILRLNFAILPEATQWAAPALAVFGAVNILYGAFCAFAQTDLKRLVAYSSVSHMGYCLLGMAALTETGISGALMQMWSHGIVSAMLFLLVGVLYDRTHTREIARFGGLAAEMPRYAMLFGLAFMASLGLPGLSGFIGEALVLLGAFPVYRAVTMLAAVGIIFGAAYHLFAIQRVLLGPWNEHWKDRSIFSDVGMREVITLAPLAVLTILLGFYPSPILDLVRQSVTDLVGHVTRHAGPAALAFLR